MRALAITSLTLTIALPACAVPEDDAITLENADGKADGVAKQLVTLSSERPTTSLRFTCDEFILDECEVTLMVTPDFSLRDAARAHLERLGREGFMELVGVEVAAPDGERMALTVWTPEGRVERDAVRMEARWEYAGGNQFDLVALENDEFWFSNWEDGDYELTLQHTVLPGDLPDTRNFYVHASWH